MKTVLICPGPHKTATTALQKVLSRNKKKLKVNSISYFPGGSNHTKFFYAFFSDIKSHHLYDRYENAQKGSDYWQKYVKNSINSTTEKFIIVSAEDLSLLKYAEVKNMKSFLLEDCNVDYVYACITLRNPFEYINSFISQFVKAGFTKYSEIATNSYPSFTLNGVDNNDYGAADLIYKIYFQFIENYIDTFGMDNIVWLDYREARSKSIERLFFEKTSQKIANFPSSQFQKLKSKKVNNSLSLAATLSLALLNEYHSSQHVQPGVKKIFRNVEGQKGNIATFTSSESESIIKKWNYYLSLVGFPEETLEYTNPSCFNMPERYD